MQITYQVSTGDHLRCFGKSLARKPVLLLQILAAPLFFAVVNASLFGHDHKLLSFVLFFGLICLFFVIALVGQCAQRSQRPCTSTIWYDGIHDVSPEKANFIPWSNVTSVVNSNGDVFVNGRTASSTLYIARSAFPPQLPASTFVDCAERARRGDFSLIVPPPQPAYSAPPYGAYPPPQGYPPQYPPQQPPLGTWPPPPGQGSL